MTLVFPIQRCTSIQREEAITVVIKDGQQHRDEARQSLLSTCGWRRAQAAAGIRAPMGANRSIAAWGHQDIVSNQEILRCFLTVSQVLQLGQLPRPSSVEMKLSSEFWHKNTEGSFNFTAAGFLTKRVPSFPPPDALRSPLLAKMSS